MEGVRVLFLGRPRIRLAAPGAADAVHDAQTTLRSGLILQPEIMVGHKQLWLKGSSFGPRQACKFLARFSGGCNEAVGCFQGLERETGEVQEPDPRWISPYRLGIGNGPVFLGNY